MATHAPPRLRIAGHPLHPALVHFPLALWCATALWDLLGAWRGEPHWWALGYWSLALGLASALPAVVSGFVELAALREQAALDQALRHMAVMLAAAAVALGNLLLRPASAPPPGDLVPALLALSLLCVALLAVGGWIGGDLVYRRGAGRISD